MNNMKDYVLNVDVTKAQFDIDIMVDEAQKLGLDLGDLKEYGFNSKACSGKNCLNKKNIKWLDKKMKDQLGEKMLRQGADLYKRASCHPLMKKHVTPVVELILNRIPFSLCGG